MRLSSFEQRLEKYEGTKKLAIAFWRALTASLRNKLARLLPGQIAKAGPTVDFSAANPNFKPYEIRLHPQSAGGSVARPKILHVIPVFSTGGSQQLVVDLIEGLSREYIHELFVRDKSRGIGYVGVPVHETPHLKDEQSFQVILETLRPDIVHVHYWGRRDEYIDWKWYHNVFQGSAAYGCRVIENCNNPLTPYFHGSINRYVYVSEYARDTFGVRHLPNKVIYPGSNFSFFDRGNSMPDPDTIGMVYRLDQDKLNEFSIAPLISALQRRPRTKALVVGGGYYLELFRQKVAAAGLTERFTFTGYVAYEALTAYYQQMAIFVAPVHQESFGQVTPFAMNMGIPVVAYNVGALDEILTDSSVLAPAQDSDAMAEIIVELLDDPARRHVIGEANRQRANQLFSVETMVAAYQEVYQAVLSSPQVSLNID